jgi:hypothetical protein
MSKSGVTFAGGGLWQDATEICTEERKETIISSVAGMQGSFAPF